MQSPNQQVRCCASWDTEVTLVRRFTIRTKLLAGLVLVLGISAVLTTNTLIGLYSYRDTIRAFESKTYELPLCSELWVAVAQLDEPSDSRKYLPPGGAIADFDERIRTVEAALADYQKVLRKTLAHGRDPDQGEAELLLLSQIEQRLNELNKLPPHRYWDDDELWLIDLAMRNERMASRRLFREHVARLRSLVGGLSEPTSQDMKSLVGDARATYSANLWIGWPTGGLAVVMLLVLSRMTYRWIFRPIRQLHRSVQRVGQGDLSHRVHLRTGDEMQELAEAFNLMTERLQEICQNLERQVEERSRQLVRSEQLASVGFLAAGVAHEINNPLASISLGSETLERRLRTAIPKGSTEAEEVWRCLAMIQSEAFRCKGITEKLLDFSRLRDQDRQPCSLTNLVADVLDIVQHMGRYREKQIVLSSSSEVVAQVTPQEIKQVVLNLVVNALDSMDPNGTLSIDVSEEQGYAELVFTDDGCGMTSDVLQNIFQPFFTRSRSGKGTGLGLSISHRIIAVHGGQIEAISEGPGKGSRFTVRLPLVCTSVKEDQPCEQLAA